MRLALLATISLAAAAQTAPLTLPTYDMFRYATVNRQFSYRFAPSGGFAPYAFSVEEGSTLPPGLKLDATTGELSGTVPQTGEFRHVVCINDASRAQICVPFLVIAVANDGETYTELLPARVNTEYQNIVAGQAEFREIDYTPASGKIPDGMVLEVTGRIYGIPRPPGGAWAFKVQGRNLDGDRIVKPYLLRVLGPIAATTVMPSGFNGTEYSSQLTVLGDAPPHVWSVRRGPLPPGFTLSDDGRLSGVCNQAAKYVFSLRVTDSTLASHDREMALTIEFKLPPLSISTATLPAAAVGVAYRQQVNLSGGREPYRWAVLGTLPPGLTLSQTGLVSGTPTSAGSYTFTVQASDVSGGSILKTYTIVVGNLKYTGPSTISLFAQEPAKVTLTAEGGTAPYKWTVASGTLPAGVSLSDAGVLSGTPSGGTGNVSATLRVTDASARALDILITISVGPARPAISTNGIVNGASFGGGTGIAPGEIITIFGVRMGPATIAPFILDSTGRVPVVLAGTRVLFNGQPAPLLYVSAGQIGTIVPYTIGGRTSVDVVVDAAGVRSEPVTMSLAASAPGLFTVEASGRGQAAALNQDGSLNGPSRPIRAGDVVVLFGTGDGQTIPAGLDGTITGPDPGRTVLAVKVTIGGKEGTVLYSGGAPGLVAGVTQINVRVPVDVAAGDAVPVALQIGTETSSGATLAVR
ncbi:MAG: putative Ig domain-containing protein [Acidobacteria bacterium]|nr:putative Ig domain-containing protein [Acidobacteriota bacterium]